MNKKNKKEINVIKFPRNISKLERQVEAILFAAEEPLDIETIEKRVQSTSNIKKILENIQSDYKYYSNLCWVVFDVRKQIGLI